MRLVQVAKALGMTGQQLRHELESVDFGVKPTDREVPDNLAQGIIRFVARKQGIEVDMEALGFTDDEADVPESADADVQAEDASDDADDLDDVDEEKEPEADKEPDQLNVLRKLTLENVSQEAVKREEQKLKKSRASVQRKPVTPKKVAQKKPAHTEQEQIKKKEGKVKIPDQITVKEFAEKAGVQVPKVVASLMSSGVMATITQTIDYDTAAIVAVELGIDVEREEGAAEVEHLLSRNLEQILKDEKEHLQTRPPVVVVMGHVDHGKTSILDAIRQTDVVSGEAGGITQHIGAYQVHHQSKGSDDQHVITFLDTPGHEAFTAMRARGAQVTDIAIIVVAADEGIKPTTVEAIDHAKDAEVPILVALNKMDKEGADPERVKGELAGHGLQAEDWGGSVPVIPCSAKAGTGIDDLLDHVVLVSQLNEFTANPDRSAVATVIESHLDPSLGALATVVVNAGTLNTGEVYVCGSTIGKVRTMMDAHGERLESIGPSGPVRVSGFGAVPEVGDILQVVPSEAEARTLLDQVRKHHAHARKRSFADLVSRLSEGKLSQLKIVLKADTQGSLEAVQDALAKKTTEEVGVKVIHGAVGSVSENDVMMAAASDGIVVAFHVAVPQNVRPTAEREGVEVREYDVVYALLDDVDGLLKGLVEPEEEEQVLGHVEIKEIFLTKKNEQIVGGRVTDGVVKRLTFRIQRGGEEVGTGRISSLKKVDKDVKEIKEGTDCGMRVESTIAIEPGDVFEVFLRELKRKA